MSAVLTGFGGEELRATGMAAEYRALVLERAGAEPLARLVAAADGSGPPRLDEEPVRELARAVAHLWYLGAWPGLPAAQGRTWSPRAPTNRAWSGGPSAATRRARWPRGSAAGATRRRVVRPAARRGPTPGCRDERSGQPPLGRHRGRRRVRRIAGRQATGGPRLADPGAGGRPRRARSGAGAPGRAGGAPHRVRQGAQLALPDQRSGAVPRRDRPGGPGRGRIPRGRVLRAARPAALRQRLPAGQRRHRAGLDGPRTADAPRGLPRRRLRPRPQLADRLRRPGAVLPRRGTRDRGGR